MTALASRMDSTAPAGNNYVYDVTKPEDPKLVTSVVGMAGIFWGLHLHAEPRMAIYLR